MLVKGIISIVLLCIPLSAHSTIVEGRVFTQEGPLEEARVSVYRTYQDLIDGRPFATSEPSSAKGVYRMDLPSGEYYFTSRGEQEGKGYFSYHGNNPIKIEQHQVWVTLLANEVKKPVYADGVTSLKGVVTFRGIPVPDAFISLYTQENKRFKGLGFRTESIDDDGTFHLPVPPNKYILIARKMEGDNKIRPLRNRDLYCYYPDNPVEVKSDRSVTVEVPCYPKGDRDSFVDEPVVKASDAPTVEDLAKDYRFGIKGRVVDIEGRPLKDIYVLAYRGNYETVFMMFHVSHGTEYAGRTDEKGNFFIPIDADGDYHILARDILGGSPRSGEAYGLYGGNPRHIVRFKKGDIIENINVTVGEAMTHEVRYAVKETVKVDSAHYESDFIIDRDTVWKGVIVINGTLWVKRGATLIIEPGTVVKFRKTDKDNNGIGDGELIIEGRIIAQGTKKARILFTSAEERPEMRDWSYVLFLATGSDNVFDYCDFKYAFSGLQIHYSNAVITNCLFEQNSEGLRYNRSNVRIEHNNFVDNEIGVRFVRLEGKAVITRNLITRNNVGILFMQPHAKTVNFYLEPPVNELQLPLLSENNIHENTDYNYKMGERRSVALSTAKNWWGSTHPEIIDELIYDRKDDDNLGEVMYAPYLAEPVRDAGIRGRKYDKTF